jgi:class 3 adenylate cyclase
MCAAPVKRKLAAILAADAVGYSKLMSANEEGTMKILAAHRAVIDGIIEFHEGRIINTAGDSVLAEFGSPVEAVRCAVEIQDALKTRNDSLPETQRLLFRIGVNLGDVMEKGSDLLGDGVNVAARLESIAEPGGICVSSSVYDQIAGKLDLGFVNIGTQSLKNIQRPIQVYRVERGGMRMPGAAPAPKPMPRRRLGLWAAGVLGSVIVVVALAWYFGVQPAREFTERSKVEAELARARAEAEQSRQRADSEAAAALQAKRELEEQRVAETRARAEAELARARADAEGTRRKADAELARAADARRAAEADAKAAAAAKPGKVPRTALAVASPAAAPARRYEGNWKAVITCEAYQTSGPFTEGLPISNAGDAFIVERGVQGQPGSYRVRGAPDRDGRLQLLGGGISRLPQSFGKSYPAVFDGKFADDRYEGNGRLGGRKCLLTISRAQ